MNHRNGTATARNRFAPADYGSLSSQVLYSRDVSGTKTFEHEKNVETARSMGQAWTSILETLCQQAYPQTFPFLEAVERYLRQKGDPREVIEYDQRKTKVRDQKIRSFYRKMSYLRRVTPHALTSGHYQQGGGSRPIKNLETITRTVLSLPLDRGLWLDFTRYLADDEGLKPANSAEVKAVVSRFISLRNELAQGNLRLVFPIARKFQGRGLAYPDLLQEGNIGLMRGVEKYDYTKGYTISTYATHWIKHHLQRALADRGKEIRTPAHTLEKMSKLRKAEARLEARLGRKATQAELAAETNLKIEKVEQLLEIFSRYTFSMQAPRYHTEDPGSDTIEDTLESGQAPSPLETMMKQSLAQEIEQGLETLTPQERQVLTWRFGIGDDKDLTLEMVGQKYDRTRERIRQIEEKALSKLNRMERLRALAKRNRNI